MKQIITSIFSLILISGGFAQLKNPLNNNSSSFHSNKIGSNVQRDLRVLGDQDNDGVMDSIDIDSDNDGLLNTEEIFISHNAGNTDADLNPDYLDLDSDNDGIPDIIEAGGIDADGDGMVDGFIDINNDGWDDNIAANPLVGANADGDPYWNGADLDSDNDGITDVVEAGGSDPDNNGQIGTGTGILITDTDGDGFSDLVDTDNGGTVLLIPNTDGSGQPDYLDLDSDGDGIVDNIEAQLTISYLAFSVAHTDNDGIVDAYDNLVGFGGAGISVINTDGIDNPDYRDTDSDNDGDLDALEGWDTDNNGIANTMPLGFDADGDGIDNAYDTNDGFWETDNNQTPLSFPNLDNTASIERDWRDILDNDNDGVSDSLDIDSDNDGILDVSEIFTAHNSGNSDYDAKPDYLDLDSDNDGIADIVEAGGVDVNGDGLVDGFIDTNGDGWDDNIAANPFLGTNTDGDPFWDGADLDSDNDGITDVIEAGGSDPDNNGQIGIGTGISIPDVDGDGFSDVVDSDAGGMPLLIPNTDGIGKSNYLDIDSDEDGIVDNIEAQLTIGYLAASVADADMDGITDPYDNIVGFGGSGIIPINTDGADKPDYLDTDSDNDGDLDAEEGWDTDNNGTPNTIPLGADTDNDGLDNAYDTNDALWETDNNQTPTSFPNLDDATTYELDWRDLVHLPIGFFIPNGFSPNGDGTNDNFVIIGLNLYPGSELSIFNRWGNRVYFSNDYNNDWNGEGNEGITVGGNLLPIGTYFYILDLGSSSQKYNGYVYLNR